MSVGTTAAIVGLGVAAGTSVAGGIIKSKTATSAAEQQAQAAQQAGQGVTDATNKVNPDIIKAATGAGEGVVNTADTAANNVAFQALDARDRNQAAAVTANSGLDNFANAGRDAADLLKEGIAKGGDFNKNPTLADLQIDPGYKFRLDQGTEALTRQAAAHGGVGGGGYQKDLNDYVQGSASQEYQKAFDRFETSTQNRFSNLNTVSNSGQAAATKQGNNLIDASVYGGDKMVGAATYGGNIKTDAAKYYGDTTVGATDLTSANTINAAKTAGDYATQGANAKAAGQVASSNALWDGFGGAANQGLSAVLSNPARNYINPYGGLNGGVLPRAPNSLGQYPGME